MAYVEYAASKWGALAEVDPCGQRYRYPEGMEQRFDATEFVHWDAAPAHILGRVSSIGRPWRVIGVTGRVGAGKSTLAKRLGGIVLSTDDYLPDYEGLDPLVRDDPKHADLASLARNVEQLKNGAAVEVPVWSFQTHRREGKRVVEASPLIVIEGIHALHRSVAQLLDCAVFVEASEITRWSRWEAIELAGERGWGVEKARQHFESVAEPTFARFEEEYRRAAHVVVRNEGEGKITK